MKEQTRTAHPLVRLEEVYKYHYTDELQTAAINGVSLDIHPGEFVAIMGPSGSGKSTLLNLIGMIDEPSRGKYYFRGQDTTQLSRQARSDLRKRNLAFVFQSFNLIDELTSFENVELPLIYLKVARAERKARVEQVLAQLDMLHRRNHYPAQLSGGQQQRIAIARAVVTNPALILADEPTGNLDSANGKTVMEQLQNFHAKGSTIIMVTHSEHDASFAQRQINLFDGSMLVSESAYLQNQ
ncbi:MAG: ABC transporter ATP-binding protein [Bacteroidota bacterium]